MSQKKITIKEIASLAGVSKGTVSRVLNDTEGVGEKTRNKIKKLIKELNYQPNAFAQGLAAQKTRNIGLIVPHEPGYFLSNNYWPSLLSSITAEVVNREYTVLLSTAREEGMVENAYRSVLKGKKVDGLILGAEILGPGQLKTLDELGLPFVMVGKCPYRDRDYVDIDNEEAAFTLTGHMLRQGYKRILMIAGPANYLNVRQRIDGFEKALKQLGGEGRVFHTPYHTPDWEGLKKELIREYKPRGIILGASDFAYNFLRIIESCRISVPQDLGVAFFDSLEFFSIYRPGITAVGQPIKELGSAAAAMLFRKLDSNGAPEEPEIQKCSLEIRRSCGEN